MEYCICSCRRQVSHLIVLYIVYIIHGGKFSELMLNSVLRKILSRIKCREKVIFCIEEMDF